MLEANPVQAFEKICEFIGKTPQQFFAEIQGSQQQQQNVDPMVANLRQQVAQLEQKLSGVSTDIQSRQEAELEQQIQAWASTKPRFNELRETMVKLAQSGMATDLDNAYEQASRLIPATASVQQAQVQTKPDLKAQTQKGQLSTTGAPISGSNPAFRKPASSATDAIDRAFSMAGIG
jgi:chromosome segregation ATPase